MKHLIIILSLLPSMCLAHGMGDIPWYLNLILIIVMSPIIIYDYLKDCVYKLIKKFKR